MNQVALIEKDKLLELGREYRELLINLDNCKIDIREYCLKNPRLALEQGLFKLDIGQLLRIIQS